MNGAYIFRLLCASLACFFLLSAALGVLVWWCTPVLLRVAGRMTARRAARFLLALRLLPAGASCFLVAALCVPSYLRLEPHGTSEQIGWACLVAAFLGLSAWGVSLTRSYRAVTTSANLARDSRRAASCTALAGEALPVWILDGAAHFPVALIGLLHSQLVIARGVLEVLSPDQLGAALRHEHAHHVSRDNLKRLLLLLMPDVLPFVDPLKSLDREWARFSEWAADDAAAGGDRRGSLSLAAALVRVARVCPQACRPEPIAFLVGSGAGLASRVERLLNPTSAGEQSRFPLTVVGVAMALLACATVTLAFDPNFLYWVHEALEQMIR